MTGPLIHQVVQTLARPVSESEQNRARIHLLDWLACVAGARRSAAAHVGKAAGGDLARTASLAGNVLEMDDVHRTALLHPGPVVWGAVVAGLGEGGPRAMEEALADAVRGYEAMIAIGAAFDAHHYSLWHPTTTAGVFGAAAVHASRLGLDERRTAWALGNAGSVAGGLWHMRHEDVLTKQWHVWHAVRTGVEAATLARSALTGPGAMLEGPQGVFAAMAREPRNLANAGEGWLIGEVSFKPFAACRHAHPAIDAAMTLREQGKLTAPFHVETYADALAFCDRPDPVTELDAKFSLQHCVALVADGRNADPADFTREAIAALADLRAQVTVAEDDGITARYPAHFGARVNGLELVDTLGDPERPVGTERIVEKMKTLGTWGGLDEAACERAVKVALEGEDAGEILALLKEWLA